MGRKEKNLLLLWAGIGFVSFCFNTFSVLQLVYARGSSQLDLVGSVCAALALCWAIFCSIAYICAE